MNLSDLIPAQWKLLAAGAAVLAFVGGYFAWQSHERSIGASGVIADDKKAVDQQVKKDAVLSDKELLKLKAKTGALDAVAEPAKAKIATDAPDQADKDAACAVRKMLGQSC